MEENNPNPGDAALQYLMQVIPDVMKDTNKKQISRHKFSSYEDELLKQAYAKLGPNDWNAIAEEVPGRTARQCRDRWKKYLSGVENGPWTEEEDALLLEKYNELGPKWAQIAQFFKSRTDNNVKNRWVTRGTREKHKNAVEAAQIPGLLNELFPTGQGSSTDIAPQLQ
ncbi:Myb-like DNA-binding domain containing protein [Trichomonas vaginalis G3]|uniref:Myb-like DNA-binding domain containing protein n=1 Tax=Trichomonas vaginalis (strain ATCC PRA-98 / G3) TaxID=412133 RepID=A2DA52_TRIV3|nr:RNA polymerase II transcription regulator recruiting protein [Trichomonas vaginalis G3]EAY22700.1 Myb-like DNA-binding domain containing protein [Trichomonas vaginalis G3]KAI5525513.1 RNA polymerase II transcription regulator recruiting protein [Trichomonas vaginalis G3]|eukprot:XP_001583686.1 Myb-like DNA-binding domain containing protein [Trichomonas vaginalis G3]